MMDEDSFWQATYLNALSRGMTPNYCAAEAKVAVEQYRRWVATEIKKEQEKVNE
jgi:hypothetical protein